MVARLCVEQTGDNSLYLPPVEQQSCYIFRDLGLEKMAFCIVFLGGSAFVRGTDKDLVFGVFRR